MKTFRYELGHPAMTTLTVKELREHLNKYPDEMPVVLTWEGVVSPVVLEAFETQSFHHGQPSEKCDCLFVDAELYQGWTAD